MWCIPLSFETNVFKDLLRRGDSSVRFQFSRMPMASRLIPRGTIRRSLEQQQVGRLLADGMLLRSGAQKGTTDGEFQLPGSVVLGPDGMLYAPDQGE